MGQPRASITFDDGPHPQSLDLLRVLEEYSVRATFFECGVHVRRHPEIAQAVASQHEIGNHTDTHPYLCFQSPSKIRREILAAQESITAATGRAPAVFRAPYGIPGLGLRQVLRDANLRPVRWTVIGRDWKWSARAVADRVLRHARPDVNICLHDGRDVNPDPDIRETIEAVRIILPELLNRGFEFVTVSELLCPTKKSAGV